MKGPVIGMDDWTVQVSREFAELSGPVPGSGPYVTIGVLRGPGAEAKAREVVAKMADAAEAARAAGVWPFEGNVCWAWSGADIVADRRRRGLA